MMRHPALVALLSLAAPATAHAEDWRMILATEDIVMLFDADTVAVDKAARRVNAALYASKPDERGAVRYTVFEQIDCAGRRSEDVAITAFRPDDTPVSVPIDRPGFEAVTKDSITEVLYDQICAIKSTTGPKWGVFVQIPPAVAARQVFALLKLGLTSKQAAGVGSSEFYDDDALTSDLNTLEVPEAKRAQVHAIVADQITQKPPPPIVPLPSAVATGRVGQYVHSEMELASGIWLKADGTFDYGLTVGSLDETAHGRWTVEGDRVRLVNEPRPVASTITPGPAKNDPRVALSIAVVVPNGRNVEDIGIAVRFDAGEAVTGFTGTNGWALPPAEKRRPRSVMFWKESYSLRSRWFPIDGTATTLTFVFTPGDFGVVDFTDVQVTAEKDGLVVKRDGGEMRYTRRQK